MRFLTYADYLGRWDEVCDAIKARMEKYGYATLKDACSDVFGEECVIGINNDQYGWMEPFSDFDSQAAKDAVSILYLDFNDQ